MLQFAGGVRFAVDIGDLLHLEAALKTDRIVQPAPDEKDVPRVGVLAGKPLDALLVLERALHLVRQRVQFPEIALIPRGVDLAAHLAERDGKRIHGDQLRAVRLGRGDGDLRTRHRVQHMVRFPRDGRADHVDDCKRRDAVRLRRAKRRKGIRRFAGLRHHDDQRVLGQQQLPIAEFRRKLHAHRKLTQVLGHVLRKHPDVPSRAAGDDVHFIDPFQKLFRQSRSGQIDPSVLQ